MDDLVIRIKAALPANLPQNTPFERQGYYSAPILPLGVGSL